MRVSRRLAPFAACAALVVLAGCSSTNNDTSTTVPEESSDTSATETSDTTETSDPQLGDAELDPTVRDITVLVVGDSLAHSMGEGMSQAVSEAADSEGAPRDVTIVNAAMGGCGLLQPLEQPVDDVMKPTEPTCNDYPTTWAGAVEEYNPDVIYLTTSFWDAFARFIFEEDGPEVTIADPAVQERYVDKATEAIALLSANGATVYMDNVNSDIMGDVQQKSVDANSQNAVLLNLRGEMCSETECPAVIDGITVLDDTGHPSGESQLRLSSWLLNQLAAGSDAE